MSGREEVARRSWLAVRWRQFRNAPQPVVRAVLANLAVAVVGGVLLLLADLSLGPGRQRELLAYWIILYVSAVVIAGTVFTYLWVPLPSGASGRRRRSWWSGALGFFTSIPVAYLGVVAVFQIVRPLLG